MHAFCACAVPRNHTASCEVMHTAHSMCRLQCRVLVAALHRNTVQSGASWTCRTRWYSSCNASLLLLFVPSLNPCLHTHLLAPAHVPTLWIVMLCSAQSAVASGCMPWPLSTAAAACERTLPHESQRCLHQRVLPRNESQELPCFGALYCVLLGPVNCCVARQTAATQHAERTLLVAGAIVMCMCQSPPISHNEHKNCGRTH